VISSPVALAGATPIQCRHRQVQSLATGFVVLRSVATAGLPFPDTGEKRLIAGLWYRLSLLTPIHLLSEGKRVHSALLSVLKVLSLICL